MDIAIVTGASSSLGLAISRRLIQLGFRVYGLGGDYTDCPLQNVNFRPTPCNLADPNAVEAAAKRILEKEKKILVLVNNAKFFGTKSYLEMSPEEMQRVLNINLLSPLVLARTFAEGLTALQGYIIQLGPLHMESSRGGPTGAASAGGLKWMSELLFQDLREYGVRVCHLSPEPNRGRDPRTTPRQGTKMTAAIDPEAVAQALEQLLQSPFGNIVTEMVIRPLRVREPEHDPVVKLPYPKPKPVPYTIPREMIEAEEQLEEEEFRKKRERRRTKSKTVNDPEEQETAADNSEEADAKPAADRPVQKKKRSRRRSGSGRKPEGSGDGEPRKEAAEEEPRSSEKAPERRQESRPVAVEKPVETQESAREGQKRRRPRRKPRPPKVEVGFLDRGKEPGESESRDSASEEKPTRQPEDKPAADPAEPVRKQASRKRPARTKATASESDKPADGEPVNKETPESADKSVAGKSAKKTVPRKSTTKKAVKKAAVKKSARKTAAKKSTTTHKTARKKAAPKAESDEKSD